jgi:hypothetical protein
MDRTALNAMPFLLGIGIAKYFSSSVSPKTEKMPETFAEIRLGQNKVILKICGLLNFPVFSHE